MDGILLLHASDFHVKASEGDPLLRAKDIRKLFAYDAEKMAKMLGKPNALIFSGDIAHKGDSAEYDVAHEMLSGLASRLGLKNHECLVVPGNHDVDRGRAAKIDARVIRDKLRIDSEEVAEQTFVQEKEKLLEPLVSFQEFAISYDCLIPGDSGFWEVGNHDAVCEVDYLKADFDVSIRGISTVHVSDRNDDQLHDPAVSDEGCHLYVSGGQLWCDPVSEDGPFRILVGHHHPVWWRFSESRRKLASARFHVQLYGHEHLFAPSIDENSVVVRAGAINPDPSTEDSAQYNWIMVTKEDGNFCVRIWSRVFDEDRHEFVDDKRWSGGRGYVLCPALSKAPVIIDASAVEEQAGSVPDGVGGNLTQELGGDSTVEEVKKKSLSPNAIRYLLMSQNHATYSRVFRLLGFEPNDEQQYALGGLEYYEAALDNLLTPERISGLVKAMEEVGVSVD